MSLAWVPAPQRAREEDLLLGSRKGPLDLRVRLELLRLVSKSVAKFLWFSDLRAG